MEGILEFSSIYSLSATDRAGENPKKWMGDPNLWISRWRKARAF